jgi:NAD(P)-dependent dehydrogenase (short-subunit alcohol dehydrogenase family)
MTRFEGRVGLVVGGAAGSIGAATARRLAREGTSVVVAGQARDPAHDGTSGSGDREHDNRL